MASKRYHYSGATFVAVLVGTLVTVGAASCVPRPPGDNGPLPPATLTLNEVPICLTVDGAAQGQTYPCVWEEAHEEAQPYPGRRWTLYVQAACPYPIDAHASSQGVQCIDVRAWVAPE
jgi:hypothetical protein